MLASRRARITPEQARLPVPAAPQFFTDWDKTADDIAATLRAEAGRNPCDKNLTDLIYTATPGTPDTPCRRALRVRDANVDDRG